MDKNDTPQCGFSGCWNPREYKNTGFCQSHQLQYRRGDDLRPLQARGNKGERVQCAHSGCDAYSRTRGYCKSHYMKWLRTGTTYGPGSEVCCIYEGCNRAVDVRGYCERHYGVIRDSGSAPWSTQRAYACRVRGCDRAGQYGMCNKHAVRATRFGLSWDDLATLMANGMCEACGFEGLDLDIHHDHSCCDTAGRSCGKCVVAYLCGPCNTSAGMVKDDPARLRALADLIERGVKKWD